MNRSSFFWAFAALSCWCATGHAYTSLPSAADFVFDSNGIAYLTSGATIRRYDTRSHLYLSPFQAGQSLRGIDLSPDGKTLAMADAATHDGKNWIHLVDTSSGNVQDVGFPLGFGEGGTFMVAWGADGRLLVSSNYNGSGFTPIRRYDPQLGVTTNVFTASQSSMLTPSADRKTIGIAESNISSGPVHAYDVTSQHVRATVDTNWFTFEVAVDRDGDKFLVPTYFGGLVFDQTLSSFQPQGKIGQYADHGPLAAVFSPVNDTLFTAEWAWSFSSAAAGVRVYNANTLALKATLDPFRFGWHGNFAGPGRMEVSPDGHWLAVSFPSEVRLYDVSAFTPEPNGPLMAMMAASFLLGAACKYGNVHGRDIANFS
jgi:WD40 repeat protein